MIANELMTRDPITVEADATIREARMLMWENDLRHIPVVEDGKLVGMVSIGDLMAQAAQQNQTYIEDLLQYLHGRT